MKCDNKVTKKKYKIGSFEHYIYQKNRINVYGLLRR